MCSASAARPLSRATRSAAARSLRAASTFVSARATAARALRNASRRLRLTTGSDTLNYNIYRDAGRQLVWGNTPGVDTGTQTIAVPNNGSASVTFTLFGRIDALQEIRPGNYTDALTVTVTF